LVIIACIVLTISVATFIRDGKRRSNADELRQLKEQYLEENIKKTNLQKELARTTNALDDLKKPDLSLRGRVLTLANDILAFLKEKDCKVEWDAVPRPDPLEDVPVGYKAIAAAAMFDLRSVSVANHDALMGIKSGPESAVKQQMMDAIHYGFERQFKARLSVLILELKENGARDSQLEKSQDGGSTGRYYCENIRHIAERLLVVWSRIEP
jgi:hypothetical protein